MKNELRLEYQFRHPPEKVWKALASRDTMARWLLPNDFEPRVGHKFNCQVLGNPQAGFAGMVVNCEVLECDPPRRLAYTWNGGGLDTRVVFTLQAEGTGTRLVMEQTGFENAQNQSARAGAQAGWKGMLDKLAALVEAA